MAILKDLIVQGSTKFNGPLLGTVAYYSFTPASQSEQFILPQGNMINVVALENVASVNGVLKLSDDFPVGTIVIAANHCTSSANFGVYGGSTQIATVVSGTTSIFVKCQYTGQHGGNKATSTNTYWHVLVGE